MTKKIIPLVLASMFLITGCQTTQVVTDVNYYEQRINVKEDSYSKKLSIIGPVIEYSNGNILLYYTKSQLGEECGVEILDFYAEDNFRKYQQAFDSEGTQLPLNTLSRRYTGVGRVKEETVHVKFTKDYLISHASKGLDIKIFGVNGDRIYQIPANYTLAFVSKIPQTPAVKEQPKKNDYILFSNLNLLFPNILSSRFVHLINKDKSETWKHKDNGITIHKMYSKIDMDSHQKKYSAYQSAFVDNAAIKDSSKEIFAKKRIISNVAYEKKLNNAYCAHFSSYESRKKTNSKDDQVRWDRWVCYNPIMNKLAYAYDVKVPKDVPEDIYKIFIEKLKPSLGSF